MQMGWKVEQVKGDDFKLKPRPHELMEETKRIGLRGTEKCHSKRIKSAHTSRKTLIKKYEKHLEEIFNSSTNASSLANL